MSCTKEHIELPGGMESFEIWGNPEFHLPPISVAEDSRAVRISTLVLTQSKKKIPLLEETIIFWFL